MWMLIRCSCGTHFRVDDRLAGNTPQCPECKRVLTRSDQAPGGNPDSEFASAWERETADALLGAMADEKESERQSPVAPPRPDPALLRAERSPLPDFLRISQMMAGVVSILCLLASEVVGLFWLISLAGAPVERFPLKEPAELFLVLCACLSGFILTAVAVAVFEMEKHVRAIRTRASEFASFF